MFLNEFEAILPESMLRGERSSQGGGGDTGFDRDSSYREPRESIAFEHAQGCGGDLRGACLRINPPRHDV